MIATERNGQLRTLNDKCFLDIPGYETVYIRILPEISDSKSAKYSDDTAIGRATPIKSYAYSDNRVLAIRFQFLSLNRSQLYENMYNYYAISSLTYPRGPIANGPYAPPPVCRFKCGQLLGDRPLSVVLDNYSLTIPTDVVWDDETLMPYYFVLSTSWHVVYSSNRLPNQEMILAYGGV